MKSGLRTRVGADGGGIDYEAFFGRLLQPRRLKGWLVSRNCVLRAENA